MNVYCLRSRLRSIDNCKAVREDLAIDDDLGVCLLEPKRKNNERNERGGKHFYEKVEEKVVDDERELTWLLSLGLDLFGEMP
jgi:hypothetical protein